MIRFTASIVAVIAILTVNAVCRADGIDQPIHVRATGPQISDRAVSLGAGDALGRACYTRYVAVVRAHQQIPIYQADGPAPQPRVHAPLIARASRQAAPDPVVDQIADAVRDTVAQVQHNA